MRKNIVIAALCVMAFSMIGCAGERQDTNNQEQTEEISSSTSNEAQTEDTILEEAPAQAETTEPNENSVDTQAQSTETGDSNILIAYFTWADNTHVENPESVDLDATTSASVLAPGNAAKMASWIQEEVGGDLFSIQVEEPYSSDYDECLDRAADEKAENARPALSVHVENMEQYDVVFLGFPNWWYTLPMPIHSFIEEYDFEGKTVIPFCTHGTGGLASTIIDLEDALPQSVELLEPIGVYRPDVDDSQPEIQEWINSLTF